LRKVRRPLFADATLLTPPELGSTLSAVPLSALHAELQRRQDDNEKPKCGGTGNRGVYNMGSHVFALFLILILSTLGKRIHQHAGATLTQTACSFPVIARRFPRLPIPRRFLFLSRHFGTGVLIATAFIHLLPTAFVSLTDPCLPDFWNKDYPPMAGAIAMLAVFVVVTIEMFFATRGAKHQHDHEWAHVPNEDEPSSIPYTSGTGRSPLLPQDEASGRIALSSMTSPTTPSTNGHVTSPPPPPFRAIRTHADDEDDVSDLDDIDGLDPMSPNDDADTQPFAHPSSDKHRPSHKRHDSHGLGGAGQGQTLADRDPQKALLQCLLLEAGILFHSVFIGMAVSVAKGTAFVVLLIAICFHQTFEGFALGSRIASLIPALFPASSPRPWLMCLAYGATTPIGQAIGIWMNRLYDPASETGLLMVGITNAISSGLLLFAGLVQLMAEDFLSDRSYEVLKGRRRVQACAAVGLGGVLMAIVGAFA
jgi:zinc transporter ZupT